MAEFGAFLLARFFVHGKKGKTMTYDTPDSYDSEVFGVFREAHLYHQAFQVPKMEVLAHISCMDTPAK